MSNLDHWNRFADIDPKFTKKITGKAYQGTSPNPQYVIRCLTEMFGPVGVGFGWRVVEEAFTPLGPEILHWCRIEFWHTDRANTFDSYGQTKALLQKRDGSLMSDEDAPKKSLTDAIIKAASHVGVGANIFLGRWDDQKYVAEVEANYRKAEAESAFDADAVTDRIVNALSKAAQLPNVQKITFSDAFKETFARLAKDYPDHAARIQQAETAALARVDPAMQRPADEAA